MMHENQFFEIFPDQSVKDLQLKPFLIRQVIVLVKKQGKAPSRHKRRHNFIALVEGVRKANWVGGSTDLANKQKKNKHETRLDGETHFSSIKKIH